MKISEKIDHILRQYSYRRRRSQGHNKNKEKFYGEEFIKEVDLYIDEIIQEIDRFLPKGRR